MNSHFAFAPQATDFGGFFYGMTGPESQVLNKGRHDDLDSQS